MTLLLHVCGRLKSLPELLVLCVVIILKCNGNEIFTCEIFA